MTKPLAESIADEIGLPKQKSKVVDIIQKLYDVFIQKDAILIEVNPFAQDKEGNRKKN